MTVDTRELVCEKEGEGMCRRSTAMRCRAVLSSTTTASACRLRRLSVSRELYGCTTTSLVSFWLGNTLRRTHPHAQSWLLIAGVLAMPMAMLAKPCRLLRIFARLSRRDVDGLDSMFAAMQGMQEIWQCHQDRVAWCCSSCERPLHDIFNRRKAPVGLHKLFGEALIQLLQEPGAQARPCASCYGVAQREAFQAVTVAHLPVCPVQHSSAVSAG